MEESNNWESDIKMKAYKKVAIILLFTISLLSLTYLIYYISSNNTKAKMLCQNYFDRVKDGIDEPFCYGYLRLGENESFILKSKNNPYVYGTRNMRTGEERIFNQGVCYYYPSIESEPVLLETDVTYEEILYQIINAIDAFSEEMILSVSLYNGPFSILNEEALPIFWAADAQLLELELARQSDHFSPKAASWAQIALYSDNSSLFSYNFNPYEKSDSSECIFLATAQQMQQNFELYGSLCGWQGHALPQQ